MTTKIKKNGVYTDPVGIFTKKNGAYVPVASVSAKTGGAYVTAAPIPDGSLTFDYVPKRDGLALLTGGPTLDGYKANAQANPTRKWAPRMYDGNGAVQVAKGVLSGNDSFEADPEFAWSNGFNPFIIDANGDLVIRAQKIASVAPAFAANEVPNNITTSAPHTWITGNLCSNASFRQSGGYFEIECKVDTSKAVWPAFWTLTDENYTKRAEIDIMERVGDTQGPNAYHTNLLQSEAPLQDSLDINAGVPLDGGFHKFGAWITSTQVKFYLDRKLVRTADISNKPKFNDAHFILLTNPVGTDLTGWVGHPDATTHDPADFVIRSVKVWQAPGPVAMKLTSLAYLDDSAVGSIISYIEVDTFGGDTNITVTELSDTDNIFTVDNAAGTITGSKVRVPLKLSQVVLATADSSHPIRLRATDSKGRTYDRTFTVTAITATPVQSNLITTQDLTAAFWGKGGLTTIDASTVQETATTEDHLLFANGNTGLTRAAGVKTIRVFDDIELVAGGPTLGFIQCFDAGYGNQLQANFDLANLTIAYVGTSGGWTGAVGFITPLPNGKIRIGADFTTDATSTGLRVFIRTPQTTGGNSWLGAVTRRAKHSNIWVYNKNAAAGAF